MLCPYGHKKGTRVVDSRTAKGGRGVRRRRECVTCATRFTTYEEIYTIYRFLSLHYERRVFVKKNKNYPCNFHWARIYKQVMISADETKHDILRRYLWQT